MKLTAKQRGLVLFVGLGCTAVTVLMLAAAVMLEKPVPTAIITGLFTIDSALIFGAPIQDGMKRASRFFPKITLKVEPRDDDPDDGDRRD